ncbi:aldose 1-epimerase [Pseudogemmobacter bohemicus]|uniref:aldose 1-epimerase n=1 Tax=Pseudogemmobacter bohemicus TaxID=2250708 RepID=UPI000DD4BC5D|nr:aldose 1-epimerase [Pseudogemmobacter bohemicus]
MAGIITLEAGDLSLRLSGRGGAILDFRLGGRALLRPGPDGAAPGDSACFPLLPLGNRIRGNRFAYAGRNYEVIPNAPPEPLHLHGSGWLAEWTLAEADQGFARLTHTYDGPDLPHRYIAEQTFTLMPDALRITLSIRNTGTAVLPFGLGWHPFFPPGAKLTAPAEGFWAEGPDHLPMGQTAMPADLDFTAPSPLPLRWINNAFDGWSGHARLDWPDRSLTLTADPLFSCYQLYQPQDATCFAFEPMSHLPDALSQPEPGGLHPLAPGERLAGGITLSPAAVGALS